MISGIQLPKMFKSTARILNPSRHTAYFLVTGPPYWLTRFYAIQAGDSATHFLPLTNQNSRVSIFCFWIFIPIFKKFCHEEMFSPMLTISFSPVSHNSLTPSTPKTTLYSNHTRQIMPRQSSSWSQSCKVHRLAWPHRHIKLISSRRSASHLEHGLSVRTSSAACTSRNATTCSIRKCFFVPPISIAHGQRAIAFSLNWYGIRIICLWEWGWNRNRASCWSWTLVLCRILRG